MQLNASKVQNEAEVLGNRPPAPGRYCFTVMKVDESFQNINAVIVDLRADFGTVPGQEGLVLSERFFMNDDNQPTEVHLRFALATKIMTPGQAGEVSLQSAVGRQLVAGVTQRLNKKDNKNYTNIDENRMAMWGIDHPAVQDVMAYRPGGAVATPAAAAVPVAGQPVPQQPVPVAAQPAAVPPATGTPDYSGV